MQLAAFDFPFDPQLVAIRPVDPRDAARLMVVPRSGGPCAHRRVSELPDLLGPKDVLVVNDTRVLPARVMGSKRSGGGKVDLLFLKEREDHVWEVLVNRRVKSGQVIDLDEKTTVTVHRQNAETLVRSAGPGSLRTLLEDKGRMPLPPYIKRAPQEEDRIWYQTIFAKHSGAIAAPTAGLHFTDRLLTDLRRRGVTVASVTLHVGLGTFLPVRTWDIREHRMSSEAFQVPLDTVEAVRRARSAGGRIAAVGTTVVRALEAAVGSDDSLQPMTGETNLYITPGYRFRVVDALLTNFHLPRSTLLMLVSAFTGVERMHAAYGEAIRQRYRLYSYGDAMLIS